MSDVKEIIARRAARELHDGDIVNLGIGLPTFVTDYLDSDIEVILQSENGILGMKGAAEPHEINPDVTNAGGSHVSVHKFASFFDSATSFGFIMGGHVGVTIRSLAGGQGRLFGKPHSAGQNGAGHGRSNGPCGRREKRDCRHDTHRQGRRSQNT